MSERDTQPEFQAPGFTRDAPPPPPVGMPPTAPPASAAPGQPGRHAHAQQAHAAPSEGLYAPQAQPQPAPQQARARTWLGITSLAVGAGVGLLVIIGAIAAGWVVLVVGVLAFLPAGIAAVVLGHLGLRDTRTKETSIGFPVAGLIVGYVLIAFSLVAIALYIYLAAVAMSWGGSEY